MQQVASQYMVFAMVKSSDIIRRDKAVLSTSMTRDFDFVFKKGRGCNIWDTDGKKYLDFAAGISVMAAGQEAPPVVGAIKKKLAHTAAEAVEQRGDIFH